MRKTSSAKEESGSFRGSGFATNARVPMACHSLAECADRGDIEARIVYNLSVFNTRVFFESHQVHQNRF